MKVRLRPDVKYVSLFFCHNVSMFDGPWPAMLVHAQTEADTFIEVTPLHPNPKKQQQQRPIIAHIARSHHEAGMAGRYFVLSE